MNGHLKINIIVGTAAIIALLSVAPAALAVEGYYTEEEVRTYDPVIGRDKIVKRKTWYADDRWRKEEVYYGTTIARFDLDRIYILDIHTKTALEITPEFLQAHAGEGFSAFGRHLGDGKYDFPEDLYVRTGTTKSIGPWDCYQVTTNPKYRSPKTPYAVFWYCKNVDFPVRIYGEQLKQLFGDSPEVNALFDRLNTFEGYPVRTEAHMPNANQVTTLIKVEYRKDLDPVLFEVPEEYTRIPFAPESLESVEEQ